MDIGTQILKRLQKKPLHFSLLDPDKQSPKQAGDLAKVVTDAGSSAIMVGGSTLQSHQQVDATVKAIKNASNLPVILFPSGAKYLSPYADAVFFMSLLNSRNLDYVIREHTKGSLFIQKAGLEPLSMGYVIVEPGMTVGEVGEADLLERKDLSTAVGYALAAQYLGMKFFYLEAGSGAPSPVPNEMIHAVRQNVDLPLLVGGGICTAAIAREKVQAGAHVIITGTTLEKERNLQTTLSEIITAIEEEGIP
jgi:phosphoglycerol geranylgeranyltransferase